LTHDPIRRFIDAFNEGDLDALVAVLDSEVEIHSMRGMRKGADAARAWATRAPGGVQQAIVLDQLYEDTDRAVALITRRWRWAEDDSPAGEDEMAWLFELRDGRVRSWRPFEDRAEALRAGGFEHGTGAAAG
jgi:ketosteroid isomerase-like protein